MPHKPGEQGAVKENLYRDLLKRVKVGLAHIEVFNNAIADNGEITVFFFPFFLLRLARLWGRQ